MQKLTRINQAIKAREVHLIDEKGESQGTVSLDQALLLAHQRGFDLVEVSSSIYPPVCRLLDFGKYKYKLEKEERKSKQKKLELKEIRMKLTIEPHDLEVKKDKVRKFLDKGHKVKITVVLKGREMAFLKRGFEFIANISKQLGEKYLSEGPAKKLGNRISLSIVKK